MRSTIQKALSILPLFISFSSVGNVPEQTRISVLHHEDSDFRKMARISPAQAVQSALHVTHGDIHSVALGNLNGYLVYAVEVICPRTGLHEIDIDAGTGKIISNNAKDFASRKPASKSEKRP